MKPDLLNKYIRLNHQNLKPPMRLARPNRDLLGRRFCEDILGKPDFNRFGVVSRNLRSGISEIESRADDDDRIAV